MGVPKDLNNPVVYAEALVRAALTPQRELLAAWLADEREAMEKSGVVYPFQQWYLYFADRLLDMMPRPELGFQSRPKRVVPVPKIGRNDPCPCGSGKKHKQCHLVEDGGVEAPNWKLGSPTPTIRAMSVANLVHQLPLSTLDQVPVVMASPLALSEMANVYHNQGRLEDALKLVKKVLDGDREDPFLLYDYWIARYAEWLVEADRASEGEQFLLDEYDHPRQVKPWQVAQKLAAFYIDQGELHLAETWVDTALEGDGENPFNHYLRGLLAHFAESWDLAVAAYEQALAHSDHFREEEKEYMSKLVDGALERARNHLPVDEEEEEDSQGKDETSEDLEENGSQGEGR